MIFSPFERLVAFRYLRRKPLETEDIVGTVLFLASDHSKLTTGQTMMVDGGTVFL